MSITSYRYRLLGATTAPFLSTTVVANVYTSRTEDRRSTLGPAAQGRLGCDCIVDIATDGGGKGAGGARLARRRRRGHQQPAGEAERHLRRVQPSAVGVLLRRAGAGGRPGGGVAGRRQGLLCRSR